MSQKKGFDPIAAFWSKVDKGPGHGPWGNCWLWTGSTVGGGYGQLGRNGRRMPAHVYAWILVHGPMPIEKPLGCHRCDNPPCVNPTHIFPGTQKDNALDMAAKGRSLYGRPATVFGSRNGSSKLTDAKVRDIRIRVHGGETKASVARRYGVHKSLIYLVCCRKIWRHVQ